MNKKTFKLFNNTFECCGCEACVNVCPKSAIEMSGDNYGFLYPQVDYDKCIKCGFCQIICPLKNKFSSNQHPMKVYAAQSKNKDDLIKSSSGGIFATVAKNVILNNGIVFGAAYDDNLNVRHIGIERIEDLHLLQGSKYVQSYIKDVYKNIERLLKNKRLVLFSGTPCQVAGLKSFLRHEYENLITIDLICHGIPSQRMFKEFIRYLSVKLNAIIKQFKFRDKTTGDIMCGKIVLNKNGNIIVNKVKWPLISYYYYFEKCEIFRDSCYSCKFACPSRCGDITLGDFWGFEYEYNKVSNLNVDNGISVVLVNTIVGKRLIDACSNDLNLMTSSFDVAAKYNHNLVSSSTYSNQRNVILNLFKDFGYKAVDDYFYNNNKININLFKIKQVIPKKLKIKIKRLKKYLNL